MIYLWTWFIISYGLGGWWGYKISRQWPRWFRAEGRRSVISIFIMSPFVVPAVLVLDIFVRRGWIPEPDNSEIDRFEEGHSNDRL